MSISDCIPFSFGKFAIYIKKEKLKTTTQYMELEIRNRHYEKDRKRARVGSNQKREMRKFFKSSVGKMFLKR